MRRNRIYLTVCFAFILLFSVNKIFAQSNEIKLVFGNPSGATADLSNENNYLVAHTGYILSYNRERGAANWVAWHTSKTDIGKLRINSFAPDTDLPKEWWIKPTDYKFSRYGYQRGHMCPSADRSAESDANIETFKMSNMQPQTPELNERTWRYLEEYTRTVVKKGNEAYVYAGCYGNKGKIKDKITIPTNCFKIILFVATGGNDLDRVTGTTEIIAVDMPNSDVVNRRWRSYVTTVDEIEAKTGYDFLDTLPEDIENSLEQIKYGN